MELIKNKPRLKVINMNYLGLLLLICDIDVI